MADRDKVICDLQILRTWCAVDPIYGIGLTPRECEMAVRWLDDALALFKAQEPVTPCRDTFLNWRCGYCKTEIDRYDGHKYCPNCGRKVQWE